MSCDQSWQLLHVRCAPYRKIQAFTQLAIVSHVQLLAEHNLAPYDIL